MHMGLFLLLLYHQALARFGLILLFCYLSTAPCQPCTDAETLLAVCTSDFGKTSHIFKCFTQSELGIEFQL